MSADDYDAAVTAAGLDDSDENDSGSSCAAGVFTGAAYGAAVPIAVAATVVSTGLSSTTGVAGAKAVAAVTSTTSLAAFAVATGVSTVGGAVAGLLSTPACDIDPQEAVNDYAEPMAMP